MRKHLPWLFALALTASCGGKSPDNTPSPYIAGYDPGPVQAGYTRYILPVVKDIPPGTDDLWCQYVAGPADADRDVVAITGSQSKGGHHVVFFATKSAAPVGTSRKCQDSDQLSLAFLGGVGGEGVGAIIDKIPSDVAFRLPKGYSIMANAHYINTTSAPIDGQGVIDVKWADPSPDRKPLGLFANVSLNFSVPAGQQYTKDVTCTVQQDLQVLMFFNHEHEHGVSIYTDLTRASDGTTLRLRDDPTWKKEFIFAPVFARWDLTGDNTMTFHKGDVIKTHCAWENTSTQDLAFPVEMCVGTTIYVGQDGTAPQLACVDGDWQN